MSDRNHFNPEDEKNGYHDKSYLLISYLLTDNMHTGKLQPNKFCLIILNQVCIPSSLQITSCGYNWKPLGPLKAQTALHLVLVIRF